MRALIVILAALAAAPSYAAPGVCRYKESCGYHCCRGTPGHPQCLCSVCCNAKESDLGPDDRAATASDGKSTAKVFRHRVEFYSRKGAAPRLVRFFSEGIYPIDEQTDKSRVVICTSAEWGVLRSTVAEPGFCGAFLLNGKELFHLNATEGKGLSREPVGLSTDGKEAVFAVTKARKSGDREIVAYRVWRNGSEESIAPDSERAREILQKYQGRLVLTNPHGGD